MMWALPLLSRAAGIFVFRRAVFSFAICLSDFSVVPGFLEHQQKNGCLDLSAIPMPINFFT
jgi:hypothetical protein